MVQKFCLHCEASFERLVNRQAFCSPKCRSKNQWKKNYARNGDKLRARSKANNIRFREYNLAYKKAHYFRVQKKRNQAARISSPWVSMVLAAKQRALKKNIQFDLTDDWAKERWTGRCEITNLPFELGRQICNGPFSPSIDKINPKNGYTKDNSRFVLMAVNALKFNGTDEEMLLIAKAIISSVEPKDSI